MLLSHLNMIYREHNITKQFGMETAPLKTKLTAFKGHVPIRSKLGTIIMIFYWNREIHSHIWEEKFHTNRKRPQLQK